MKFHIEAVDNENHVIASGQTGDNEEFDRHTPAEHAESLFQLDEVQIVIIRRMPMKIMQAKEISRTPANYSVDELLDAQTVLIKNKKNGGFLNSRNHERLLEKTNERIAAIETELGNRLGGGDHAQS